MSHEISGGAGTSAAETLDAANRALAPLLCEKEEARHLKLTKARPPSRSSSGDRWQLKPDFSYPSPFVDRPRLKNGLESFHFDYRTIIKRVSITHRGESIHPMFDAPREPAVGHAVYVERDDAVEVGRRNSSGQFDEGFAAEVDAGDLFVRSVFSNISNEYWERIEFWRLIEELEESPKLHDIYFKPESNPDWWEELERRAGFEPAILRDHALGVRRAFREHVDAGLDAATFKQEPLQLSIDDGSDGRTRKRRKSVDKPALGYVLSRAVHGLSFDEKDPPLRVEPTRAGRIQIRMIGRLPHELAPVDRAEIVERFGQHLATLETRQLKTGETAMIGMMYTAVVHEPAHHNDPRNYHFHVVAHDWPAWQDECGDWNFAEAEFNVDRYGRPSVTYPKREKKIQCVSQGTKVSGHEEAGNRFIKHLRETLADICNGILERHGKEKRYDPRRYEEMEVERRVTSPLGQAAATLGKVGVSTFVYRQNAAIIWNDARIQIDRAASEREEEHAIIAAGFIKASLWAPDFPPGHPHVQEMERLRDDRAPLAASLCADRAALDLLNHREKKARSTALCVVKTCDRYLHAISGGKDEAAIRRRRDAAKAHLRKIDVALSPHRDALQALEVDLQKRASRIADIDLEWSLLKPVMVTEWYRLRDVAKAALKTLVTSRSTASPTTLEPQPPQPNRLATVINDQSLVKASKSLKVAPQPSLPTPSESPAPSIAPAAISPTSSLPTLASPQHAAPDENASALTPAPAPSAPAVTPTAQPPISSPDPDIQPLEAASEPAESVSPSPSSLPPEASLPSASPEASATESPPVSPAELPSASTESRITKQATAVDESQPVIISMSEPLEPAAAELESASEMARLETMQTPRDEARRRADDAPEIARRPMTQKINEVAEPKPAKAAQPRRRDDRWLELLRQIHDQRIRVFKREQRSGEYVFYVPSLSAAEQAVLASNTVARTVEILADIHARQELEIEQARRWVERIGRYADRLILDGESVSIETTKDRIRTSFEAWRKEPVVQAAIDAERARRNAIDAEIAALEGWPGQSPSMSFRERQRQVCAALPELDQMSQPEALAFVELLRIGALRNEFEKAAEAVDENPLARAEILGSTPGLLAAFKAYEPAPDAATSAAYMGRGGRGL